MNMSPTRHDTKMNCPYQYWLQYVAGIYPDDDPDSQRVGTNWHSIQETSDLNINEEKALEFIVEDLNKAYETKPDSKTVEDWELERITLLYSFIGHQWYYSNEATMECIATEVKYKVPIKEGVWLSGRIDKIFRRDGLIFVSDYKSTSGSINDESDYWTTLAEETQTNEYLIALHYLVAEAKKGQGPLKDKISRKDQVGGMIYDVWSKPSIRPKKVSQGDTKKFLETGKYFDVGFEIGEDDCAYTINGVFPIVDSSGKAPTIRETAEMFGARLLADIYDRPDFYFARREVARNSTQLDAWVENAMLIDLDIQLKNRYGAWWKNWKACKRKYRCKYFDICHDSGIDVIKEVPHGFVRRY